MYLTDSVVVKLLFNNRVLYSLVTPFKSIKQSVPNIMATKFDIILPITTVGAFPLFNMGLDIM